MHNLIKEIERKFENIEHKIQAKTITTDETYAENLKKLTDFYNIESLTTKSSKPLNDERENLLDKKYLVFIYVYTEIAEIEA